nr:MAG TPA: hypothetical protein [Crassvirales sp.]
MSWQYILISIHLTNCKQAPKGRRLPQRVMKFRVGNILNINCEFELAIYNIY